MIVPDHWAEARRQHREPGRQVTVRRFGWSATSAEDAQAMADRRAEEALRRLLAGENLPKREPKVPYNGAVGVPIREEVLARQGEEVVTRNAYGARCLNSPVALFADVDFAPAVGLKAVLGTFAVLVAVAVAAGVLLGNRLLGTGLVLVALLLAPAVARRFIGGVAAAQGGPEARARRLLERFVAAHPAWNVRLYRTPAGLRLLATHRPCDPAEAEVAAFFTAVKADPLYVRMCLNQRCFRARLTAKPWRIGVPGHLRPRPGVWPVSPLRQAARAAWVADYEARAAGHASCRYLGSVGSGVFHERLQPVVELHDRESRALDASAPLA
jgi:hypothetical protein